MDGHGPSNTSTVRWRSGSPQRHFMAAIQAADARLPLLSRLWSFFSTIVDEILGSEEAKRQAQTRPHLQLARARFPLVVQDDDTGCGIACVAMIAGVSYEDAKAAVFSKSFRKKVFYTSGPDLRRGLERFGLTLRPAARARRFESWRRLESTSIVAVEQTPRNKAHWHWVVFVNDGTRRYVLDPSWPEIVRTDFRKMEGRSYLRVEALRSDTKGQAVQSPRRIRRRST